MNTSGLGKCLEFCSSDTSRYICLVMFCMAMNNESSLQPDGRGACKLTKVWKVCSHVIFVALLQM